MSMSDEQQQYTATTAARIQRPGKVKVLTKANGWGGGPQRLSGRTELCSMAIDGSRQSVLPPRGLARPDSLV
eukprot:scaffold304842_cov33-Tisochrysis_lutea.AAC.1